MIGFKSKEVRILDRLEKRMAVLSAYDLRNWAETTIYDIGRSLSNYDRMKGLDDLEDAKISAERLSRLVTELYRRADS